MWSCSAPTISSPFFQCYNSQSAVCQAVHTCALHPWMILSLTSRSPPPRHRGRCLVLASSSGGLRKCYRRCFILFHMGFRNDSPAVSINFWRGSNGWLASISEMLMEFPCSFRPFLSRSTSRMHSLQLSTAPVCFPQSRESIKRFMNLRHEATGSMSWILRRGPLSKAGLTQMRPWTSSRASL